MSDKYAIIDSDKTTSTHIVLKEGPEYRPYSPIPGAFVDDDYFGNFLMGASNAFKINRSTWIIYDGISAHEITPSFDLAPAQSFKIAVRLTSSEGHIGCAGSVYIDDEELVFAGATRKTTEATFTELPIIATFGLDCNIEIECITEIRSPIYKELLTEIEGVVFPKTHLLRDKSGSGWQQTDYDCYTRDGSFKIGDQIRYGDPLQGETIDIYVKNVSAGIDIEDNSEKFRILNCA